jgi:hypothetical protein
MTIAKGTEKRKNAIESAIEDAILNRTIFFENFFFPLFIGVCGQFWSAIENAIEKRFVNRIIAFYFCIRKFEMLCFSVFARSLRLHLENLWRSEELKQVWFFSR